MKKTLSVAAAAVVVLLTACSRTDERHEPNIPAGVEHGAKSETPYYYGLIEEYRGVLSGDPDNLPAIVGLGNAYADSGAWQEAIGQYEHALKLDPRNADVHTDLGVAYRSLGMPDRALAEYRKALEYEPGHLNARFYMGIVYAYDFKNYPVAIHVWEELLRLAPNHPQADYMRANIMTFRKTLKKGHP